MTDLSPTEREALKAFEESAAIFPRESLYRDYAEVQLEQILEAGRKAGEQRERAILKAIFEKWKATQRLTGPEQPAKMEGR